MQNLYKYTKYFQPFIIYDEGFTHKILQALRSFQSKLTNDPPKKTKFHYEAWKLSHQKPVKDNYYNILYIYAKMCGVKLMWRKLLLPHAERIEKGLWVMGEYSRVRIWIQIMSYYFKGHFGYKNWIKDNCKEEAIKRGYADIRSYASNLFDIQRDTIYVFIKELLEEDKEYELWLENVIKERFNLDYKAYRTDKHEYYHAISKKFHHKRMLL